MSALGFLWPILRTREAQGAQFVANPSRRLPYRGILIPTSNVKNLIAVIMAQRELVCPRLQQRKIENFFPAGNKLLHWNASAALFMP